MEHGSEKEQRLLGLGSALEPERRLDSRVRSVFGAESYGFGGFGVWGVCTRRGGVIIASFLLLHSAAAESRPGFRVSRSELVQVPRATHPQYLN